MSEFKGTTEELEKRDIHIFVKGTHRRIGQASVIENYEQITFFPKRDIESEANALLFTNSYNLLKALKKSKRLLTTIKGCREKDKWGSVPQSRIEAMIEEISDIINKATDIDGI